jgi:hypothetical protein
MVSYCGSTVIQAQAARASKQSSALCAAFLNNTHIHSHCVCTCNSVLSHAQHTTHAASCAHLHTLRLCSRQDACCSQRCCCSAHVKLHELNHGAGPCLQVVAARVKCEALAYDGNLRRRCAGKAACSTYTIACLSYGTCHWHQLNRPAALQQLR